MGTFIPSDDMPSSVVPDNDLPGSSDSAQTFGGAGQAVASGLNAGSADLLGLPVDTARNVLELGKAAAGFTWHEATGRSIPDALQPSETPDVGSSEWIKAKLRHMEGSDAVDVAQPTTLNRYLHAGSEVVPSALSGSEGGTVGAVRAAGAGAVTGAAQQAAGDAGVDPVSQAAIGFLAGGVGSHAVGMYRNWTGGVKPTVAAPPTAPPVDAAVSAESLKAGPDPLPPSPTDNPVAAAVHAERQPAPWKSPTPAQDALEDFTTNLTGAIKPGTQADYTHQALIRAAEDEKTAQGTAEGTVAGERGTPRQYPPTTQPAASAAAASGMPFGHETNPVKVPAPGDLAAQPTEATPAQGNTQAPSAAPAASPAVKNPDDRLFQAPSKEGAQETPTPEKTADRTATLDKLDDLSGGVLPTRRTSALTGDYNATGDDFQAKEVGSEGMKRQIASENDALHAAAANVHESTGSAFPDSVDSQTLDNRGRVVRNAIQAIEEHYNGATDKMYDDARAQNQGRAIPELKRVNAYLNDDSNFTNDAEIGLQRAAKSRLQRLWSSGDPDKGVPPGSVNAAEQFRQFLNSKGKNPNAWGVAKDMIGHTDMDVAEHGGPGMFEAARALRTRQSQLLEQPTGIKKLLAPSDSQGINHAIPTHKVMDYIADLPTEQHKHVMDVLRSSAHLGSDDIAKSSAAAIREIQAHAVSRIHDAATNADGTWNARTAHNQMDSYARNMRDTFGDRPDIVNNLQTISKAGNVLRMDKHYPGAEAQKTRTTTAGHLVDAAASLASGTVHHVPVLGRPIGRAIEDAAEGLGGKISEASREKQIAGRIVDRNGNTLDGKKPKPIKLPGQTGAVGDVGPQSTAGMRSKQGGGTFGGGKVKVSHEVDEDGNHMFTGGGSQLKAEPTPDGGLRVRGSFTAPEDQGKGHASALYQHAADTALENGGTFTSDEKVNEAAARRWADLHNKGYDVQKNPNATMTANKGLVTPDGSPVFSVAGKRAPLGAQIPGQRGSFSFQNDNPINRATAGPRSKQGGGTFGGERNPRSEFNANKQLGGVPEKTPEQKGILARLMGQRGAVGDVGKQSTAGMRSKQGGGTFGGTKPRGAYTHEVHGTSNAEDATPGMISEHTSLENAKKFQSRMVATSNGRKTAADFPIHEKQPSAPPPEEGKGAQLNVGLHQGNPGEPGFRKMSTQEAKAAVESTGAKVTNTSVLTPGKHDVEEPTAVMSTDRPLSSDEVQSVLAKTKQSAIPQRADNGETSMHVAPGHEQVAKEQGWDKFNPDYFREHDGSAMSDASKKNGAESEDHPDWIPQRLVTSKKAEAGAADARPLVDMKSFEATPKLFEKNMDVTRSYPNVTEEQSKLPPHELAEALINHAKENLLSLHDNVPPETRARSQQWYDGANKLAKTWSKKYGISDSAAAGALAALSPQKDWYQNVSLAQRVLDINKGKGPEFYANHKFDDKMTAAMAARPSLNKPEYQGLRDMMQGKSLGDIDKMKELSPEAKLTAKALWTRMYDEAHNDPSHNLIHPEGDFGGPVKTGKGANAKVGWGSLGEIAKAIGAIESDGSAKTLSPMMGSMHKVRNFFNNILSPNSKHGDVTIDTHAIAAALMRPLSGSSAEVAHNFGSSAGKGMPAAGGSAISGIQGLYPLYAEAYRRAAAERGILPRQMQSITWEAIRGLFPDTSKTAANSAKFSDIWNKYRKGEINQQEARRQVYEQAGGIRPPTWEGSTRSDEGGKGSGDAD
jgi:hypothetical protein